MNQSTNHKIAKALNKITLLGVIFFILLLIFDFEGNKKMSDGLVNVLLIISATLIFLLPLLSLISIFFNYKNWYLYLGLLLSFIPFLLVLYIFNNSSLPFY